MWTSIDKASTSKKFEILTIMRSEREIFDRSDSVLLFSPLVGVLLCCLVPVGFPTYVIF